eukprot:CAMPEP_0202383112 /NCGR_PEP_ID=MMETSP1127-20130417/47190_1 /ASSEMBLY_ACC=CAM_ASM_000462 /TAXON_ID=3047 /ORGANISM="Dunaliella tertiolecta, Strain CCMP1320" /LENGTH=109 /DNA_ID=CAMNT_0048982511 /DNA_START=361 /DNA_END=690 /DNA_ORIENTATION=+
MANLEVGAVLHEGGAESRLQPLQARPPSRDAIQASHEAVRQLFVPMHIQHKVYSLRSHGLQSVVHLGRRLRVVDLPDPVEVYASCICAQVPSSRAIRAHVGDAEENTRF